MAAANTIWRTKSYGKAGWKHPEQWTAEWDAYNGDPTLDPRCTIAGQYSEKSNIWQIGMSMWNLMTKHYGRSPPVAKLRTFRCVDGVVRRAYTHGWEVDLPAIQPHFPRMLRQAVKHCLMYSPADRPTLAQLELLCRNQLRRADAAITAGGLGFAAGFFAPGAPIPPRPVPFAAPLGPPRVSDI